MSTRHIPLAGTYNLRDLGGYATQPGETMPGETQHRRMLRADGLHKLTEKERDDLHALGVRTVIDLRRDHELAAAPNPFENDERVHYVNISLFDRLDVTQIPLELDGAENNVLLDLYCQAAQNQKAEIAAVLTTIAEAEDGAVLFHCTAGKDRTGIIAALLLAIAGVARADIVADYALTKAQIAPFIDDIMTRVASRGDDVARFRPLLACEPETMEGWLDHLEESYADIPAFLAATGLDQATLEKLRDRLTAR